MDNRTSDSRAAIEPHPDHSPRWSQSELRALFRQGRVPATPLDGPYAGQFLGFELGLLSTPVAALARAWMPWRGKRFDGSRRLGANVLSRDSLPVVHLVWPAYRGIEHRPGPTYHAFAFSVEARQSILDPAQSVLAIDYDRPENPRLGVRGLLDEVVEVEPGVLLGQAILRLPGLRLRLAYFALTRQGPSERA